MKAFVTGGTGFVGYNLVSALLKKGYRVVCLVRDEKKAKILPEDVEVVYGDIMKPETLNPDYFKGVDFVFHVAGVVSSHDPRRYYKVNFEGTKNLLFAILNSGHKIKKFIYTSTIASVGPGKGDDPIKEDDIPHPVDVYGKSKRKAEDFLMLFRNLVHIVIIRPTAVYGYLDMGLLPLVQNAFKIGFPIIPGNFFSFVHVSDVVKAHILSAEAETDSGDSFHISDGQKYTFEEIYNILNRISQEQFSKKIRKIVIPRQLLVAISKILGLIPYYVLENLPFDVVASDTLLRVSQRNWYCTYERAKKKLGFAPDYTAYEGLKQTFIWYWKKSVPA